MEVGRKRALSPELAGTPMAKKRSRNSDSPAHVNGAQSPVAVDEIRDNDNLEVIPPSYLISSAISHNVLVLRK
jgi:hypothetical protein